MRRGLRAGSAQAPARPGPVPREETSARRDGRVWCLRLRRPLPCRRCPACGGCGNAKWFGRACRRAQSPREAFAEDVRLARDRGQFGNAGRMREDLRAVCNPVLTLTLDDPYLWMRKTFARSWG